MNRNKTMLKYLKICGIMVEYVFYNLIIWILLNNNVSFVIFVHKHFLDKEQTAELFATLILILSALFLITVHWLYRIIVKLMKSKKKA